MWLLWWESWHQTTQHFPEARITLSALLPCTDVPFHVIHGNNVELSRSCALISKVHLAHHKDIRPHHMHDHVHLNKQGVKVFARVMKSTALGNAPGNSRNFKQQEKPSSNKKPSSSNRAQSSHRTCHHNTRATQRQFNDHKTVQLQNSTR